MKCTCPKCKAEIQLDLPPLAEEGTAVPCPECKTRFHIYNESFAARALRKVGEISCVKCGNELGHSIHCPSCGVLYPDYLVVSVGHRRVRKVKTIKEFRASKMGRSELVAPRTGAAPFEVAQQPTKKSSNVLIVTISLVVLAILVALGIRAYQQHDAENQYSANYFRALYCIKTAEDRSLKTCAKISADWKVNLDAGRNFDPHMSVEDETDLNTVRAEIEKYMKKLDPSPRKFITANEKLGNLYGAYTKLHSLAFAPFGSLPGFTDSASKLDSEFKKAAQELKASLPPKLAEKFKKAKVLYKGLRDL